MQHCKREYCNAGTRQWSQRGIYIRKASKAKNSEQIIIRSNDSRYRGYPKTEKNAIQQRGRNRLLGRKGKHYKALILPAL